MEFNSVVSRQIDNTIYNIFPVLSFIYSGGNIGEEINSKLAEINLTPLWRKSYLEKILEVHENVLAIFRSKHVGIIYFVNGKEYESVPIIDYDFKKGDRVEIVYINSDWDNISYR